MSETNEHETAHDRYLRCLSEAENAMECSDQTGMWDDAETRFWQYRARTWAMLAQSAATMCLAEATAATASCAVEAISGYLPAGSPLAKEQRS